MQIISSNDSQVKLNPFFFVPSKFLILLGTKKGKNNNTAIGFSCSLLEDQLEDHT